MGLFDAIKNAICGPDDYDDYDTSPENLKMEMSFADEGVAVGGFLEGKYKITVLSDSVKINEISISVMQKDDSLGIIKMPYFFREYKKGEIIENDFRVQVRDEYVKIKKNKFPSVTLMVKLEDTRETMDELICVYDEVAETASRDYNMYHIVPDMPELLDSSVRGELKFFECSSALVFSWNDQITVREKNGKVRWTKKGPGRTAAINQDETVIAVSWEDQFLISFYDLKTGDELHQAETDDYIDSIAWLDNQPRIVASAGENTLILLDAEGNMLKNIDGDFDFISKVAKVPGEYKIYLSDSNMDKLCIIDPETGKVLKETETDCCDQMVLSDDKKLIGLVGMGYFEILNADNFKQILESRMPGKGGMQGENQDGSSTRSWDSKIRFSPDNNSFLINVQDGQVWRFDLQNRISSPISRDIMNYVEDTCWINENSAAVIDSTGTFSIVDMKNLKVIMKEKDYQD
ncbi:MAG: WD40 repeat domain-containing protein [Spirochaetes bacterium]|nr:WD40 repeat domain-containing protein [Spirochaetota bacterium]